jgi:hypothetical protein
MTLRYVIALVLLLFASVAYAGTRVVVEGRGSTVDLAKQNAFRSAIEQVVGQVIVSDQEVRGDRLTKDWIGGYSAGYVDDFEILETRQEANGIMVKMNVAVSSSKIAKRMLSSGNKNLIVEGTRLQAQIDTQVEQRDRGDQLIAEVLTSYPHNAYVVNSGQTEVGLSPRRQAYVDVPYEIHWSRFWVEALNEALGVIAQDSKSCNGWLVEQDKQIQLSASSGLLGRFRDTPCGQEADLRVSYRKSGAWMSRTESYYFHDRQTLEVVNSQIQTPVGRQHIGLRVDLKDAGGDVIDTRCAKIDTSLFVGYTESQMEVIHWNDANRNLRPVIDGDASVYGVLRIHLRTKEQISDVARVTLNIEKTCA